MDAPTMAGIASAEIARYEKAGELWAEASDRLSGAKDPEYRNDVQGTVRRLATRMEAARLRAELALAMIRHAPIEGAS
jgi:hypothetical protein